MKIKIETPTSKPINPVNTILDFIVDTYPVDKYPCVLEIAAGNGNFASLLASKGYYVTAMDPKLEYEHGLDYDVLKQYYNASTDISCYNLGIAIHPCGIHKDIITNFKINDKAMFLMPCYTITCDNREIINYQNNDDWLNYLETLNPKMKKKVFFNNSYDLLEKSFSNAFYTK